MRNSSTKLHNSTFYKDKNIIHSNYRSKKSKKYSIVSRKNTEIYPQILLKTLLLSALKFEKATDNKARF